MAATLTDRYVLAVARRSPAKHRREIERELRAAIADGVDARVALGDPREKAEYAVLDELGDPARLAAGYGHRAVALIGPETYPGYVHALLVSCCTVLPIVYVVLALALRAHRESAWSAVFRPIGITLTVAMYLVVGVTVLFAIADRLSSTRPEAAESTDAWTPDRLTVLSDPRPARWSDVIGELVTAGVLVAALFAQRVISPVSTAAGVPVPIVNPALWDLWIPCFLAVIALAIVIRVVNLRTRRRHLITAIAGTVLTLAATVPLAWLFWQARVINPALARDTDELVAQGSWIAWLAILVLALVTAGYLLAIWRNRHGGEGDDLGVASGYSYGSKGR
ncbi:permease prefix domain 1-containing protein [Nonomuraea sp. NPDC049695]|uniref:permease prefix domain 1-containing protein n=1 Tax=Nonomuraea sp. NPDC049695 TaxID=3154734 RepID=UPI00342C7E83